MQEGPLLPAEAPVLRSALGCLSVLMFLLLGAVEPEGTLLLSSRRGRQEIVKQMEKNAEERALRAEQQDQEVQEMLKYLERLKMEDLKVQPATWGGWSPVFTLVGGSPCAGQVGFGVWRTQPGELKLWSLGEVEAPLGRACPPTPGPSVLFLFQEMERKREEQNRIQAEIRRVNDENQRRKEEQRERERMEDERVLEYQRQKMVPAPRVRHGPGRRSRGSCHGGLCRAGARGRAGG